MTNLSAIDWGEGIRGNKLRSESRHKSFKYECCVSEAESAVTSVCFILLQQTSIGYPS